MATTLKLNKMPLKQWTHEEATRRKLSPATVLTDFCRGKYPKLKIERVNARVIFVILNQHEN